MRKQLVFWLAVSSLLSACSDDGSLDVNVNANASGAAKPQKEEVTLETKKQTAAVVSDSKALVKNGLSADSNTVASSSPSDASAVPKPASIDPLAQQQETEKKHQEEADAEFALAMQQVEAELASIDDSQICLLYTSPSPRDQRGSRMPSSA